MEVSGNTYLFPPPPSSKPPPSHHFSPPLSPPQKYLSPPPPPPRKLTPSPPPPPPTPTLAPPPPPRKLTPSPPPPTPKLTPPQPTPTLAPPPPPQPQPGPPTPPHGNVIIIVFVSLSGLFFLAFIAAVLFCFLKKRKKKTAHEKEAVNVEDHIHVHETIVQGPHGEQVVTLSVDEDIKAEKVIMKDELTVAGTHIPRTMKEEPETSSNVIKSYSSS